MLLSVLRLGTKNWPELLKDMDHRVPHAVEEYEVVKRSLCRERIMENQVFDLSRPGTSTSALNCTYCTDSDASLPSVVSWTAGY